MSIRLRLEFMKISELFLDYCEIDGIQIIRILNLDIFCAISSNDKVRGGTAVHKGKVILYIKENENNKQFWQKEWIKDQLPPDTTVIRYLKQTDLELLQNKRISGDKLFDLVWIESESFYTLFNKEQTKVLICESQEKIGNINTQDNLQDDAKVVQWFEKNAEKGDPVVMFNLGILYADGRGVVQDDTKAVYWYEKAANKKCVEAMGLLSGMYESGRGVAPDHIKAKYWLNKALKSNDPNAMSYLIKCLSKGIGGTRNSAKADYLSKQEHRKNMLMGLQIELLPLIIPIIIFIMNILIQK